MSLDAVEFMRRFLMPPSGFHRVRCDELFANRHRAANLERCRYLLGEPSEVVFDNREEPANDEPELERWEE